MKINLYLNFCLRLLLTVSLVLFTNCSSEDDATAFLNESSLTDSQGDNLEEDNFEDKLPKLPSLGSTPSENLANVPPKNLASEGLADLPPPGSVDSEGLADLPPPGSVDSEGLADLLPPGSVDSEGLPDLLPPGSVDSEGLPDLPPPGSVDSEDLANVQSDSTEVTPPSSKPNIDFGEIIRIIKSNNSKKSGDIALNFSDKKNNTSNTDHKSRKESSQETPNFLHENNLDDLIKTDEVIKTQESFPLRENKSFLADGFLDELKNLHFQKYSWITPTNLNHPITSSDITHEHLKAYFSLNEAQDDASGDDKGKVASYDDYKAGMNSLLKREHLDHGYLKKYFAQASRSSSKYDTCYDNSVWYGRGGKPFSDECNVYKKVFNDSLEAHWRHNKGDDKIVAKINQYKTCYDNSNNTQWRREACSLFDDATLNVLWNRYKPKEESETSTEISIADAFNGWEIYEFDQQDIRCFGDPDGFFTEKGSSYSRWNTWSTPKIRADIASKGVGYQVITNYQKSDGENDETEAVGDNTFRVMVRKAQDAEGTLLFLDGGGGCVAAHDDPRPNEGVFRTYKPLGMQACMREASIGGSLLSFVKNSLPLLEEPIKSEGGQPFSHLPNQALLPEIKKKNIVYVPACDASLFLGDRRIEAYENNQGDQPIYYDGLRAIQAATNLMKSLFGDEENIIIHGGSAGGFGTFSGYGATRVRFPNAKIILFNDSGLGVMDPNGDIGKNGVSISINDFFMNAWDVEKYFPESHKERALKHPVYMYDYFLSNDSSLKIGLFTNVHDAIVRGYLKLQIPPNGKSESDKLSKEKFQKYTLQTTDEIQKNYPSQLTRFFAPRTEHNSGMAHTLLYWKDEILKPENAEIARAFIDWSRKVYQGKIEETTDNPYKNQISSQGALISQN